MRRLSESSSCQPDAGKLWRKQITKRLTLMNSDKLQFNRFVATPCRSLIRRRGRRGWWAYILWLPFYLLFVALFAQLTGNSVWTLVGPVIALLVMQWIYPTVLGWAVFFLPTVFFTGVGAFYVIWPIISSQERWSARTLISASFVIVLGGVCMALFIARPRRCNKADETREAGG